MNEENWKTMAALGAEQGKEVAAFLLYLHGHSTWGHSSSEIDKVHRWGDLLVALGRGLQDVVLR